MVLEITWEEDIMQLQKLGLLFGSLSTIYQQKYARMTLHWRVHLSVEADFNSEHFQFSMQKLGLSTEDEFLSDTRIVFFSSSKPKFRDLDQEIWLGETLGKSNPSLTLS